MPNRSLYEDANGHALTVAKPVHTKALARSEQLRNAMFEAVTEEDIREIVRNQVAEAKKGSKTAIKFVFDYLMAPAPQATPPKMAIAVQVNGSRGRKRRAVPLLAGGSDEWTVEQIRQVVHRLLDEQGTLELIALAKSTGIPAAAIQRALQRDVEVKKDSAGYSLVD